MGSSKNKTCSWMTEQRDEQEEDEKVDTVDELKGAMNRYLQQTLEFKDADAPTTTYVANPSLSISETPIDATIASYEERATQATVEQSNEEEDSFDDDNRQFYQCIFIAIMIGSLGILISLVFRFYDLRQSKAHHKAWYQYLHKAVEIKTNQTNLTLT